EEFLLQRQARRGHHEVGALQQRQVQPAGHEGDARELRPQRLDARRRGARVGARQAPAARGEVADHRATRVAEAGDDGVAAHQRTFSVARPMSTSSRLMIQKRTITFGSAQPLSSKWWWIGAMRKMRLPVSLNEATCRITEAVSSTKMPPISSTTISWRTTTATVPRAPPSASAPTSPMNTCAG